MTTNYARIGLDPGGTTGWALYQATMMPPVGNGAPEMIDEKWTCGQLGPEEHHTKLFTLLGMHHVQDYRVICESFEFRQGKQRDNINLMSKEYIGVAKLFGQERDLPVVFQTAGLAKPFVTDQKIKKMNLWVPGRKHSMDAMRHLIYYMVNREHRHDLIQCWRNLA